jgi:hypothetical protein
MKQTCLDVFQKAWIRRHFSDCSPVGFFRLFSKSFFLFLLCLRVEAGFIINHKSCSFGVEPNQST